MPAVAKDHNLSLRIATHPYLFNSGLLPSLIPEFERKNKLTIEVVIVNTENALKLAEKGDVDVVLVEDSEAQMSFMERGLGTDLRHFVSSYYIIIGPASDPAKIKGEKTAKYAFYKISEKKSIFVSRGDVSEIDRREKMLWESAYVKKRGDWYLEARKGMDETLMIADEKNGYTLCDEFTYLTMKDMVGLDVMIKEKDPYLKQSYNIIAVNPKRYPMVKYGAAMMFIEYLTSNEVQRIINNSKITGEQLFYAGE